MEDAVVGHSAVYSQTLAAGRHLCDAVKDTEQRDKLQTELQDLEKAWDRIQSRLDRRRDLVNSKVQVRVQSNTQTLLLIN